VVVPVYNEAENLPLLWSELSAVLTGAFGLVEVIFVDDGSTDGSTEILRGFVRADPRVRLVRLGANGGLSAALAAGLGRARGRVLVTMDSDLQNDPRDIPRLLGHLGEWDAVTGWRARRCDPWLKRVSSRIANAIRNRLTHETIKDSACTLRVVDRRCLADLPMFQGFHRFIPTLLRMAGYRVLEVPVNHRPRQYGVSHYGIRNRGWRTFQDLLAVRWMLRRRLRYETVEDP
jgi:glycosyltransferase involved in cell wall biosynthesis